MRNLFNQDDDDDDDIYEGIEYLFDESMMKENGLYYDEIKKLMSVKARKEYIVYEMKENGLYYEEIKRLMSIQENCEYVIHGRIEQEEAIEYKINYCEVNYYEYKHK